MVVREAPEHIRQLIDWGTNFDTENGELLLGREGGHSHRRIVHALGDATGHEVMRAMIAAGPLEARRRDLAQHVHDRLAHARRPLPRRAGVARANTAARSCGPSRRSSARAAPGQVYRETTNPEVATGDGHALAYRAGAELRDMEFMQFHPTVLYIAGGSRSLITEAMRGEGARLIDSTGRRFMPDYDERAELAPRDVVSRAIVAQMEKTRQPSVFLDLSHLDAEQVRKRFPGIARTCAEFGIDIATDPIPVRPGAHYMIGGVTVDHDGRTTVPGLWAAGEVTSSGLHGANRLASNSLLEGLVYGAHAGARRIGGRAGGNRFVSRDSAGKRGRPEPHAEPLDLADIRNSLKSLMWRAAGVQTQRAATGRSGRDDPPLVPLRACRGSSPIPSGWELQNMLTVASLMVEPPTWSARNRAASTCGPIFRRRDDAHWRRHLTAACAR